MLYALVRSENALWITFMCAANIYDRDRRGKGSGWVHDLNTPISAIK